VQHDIAIGGNEIGDQGRQTAAEVHISAVGKVLRGPPSDLATFLKHRRAPFAFAGNPDGDHEWLSELALWMELEDGFLTVLDNGRQRYTPRTAKVFAEGGNLVPTVGSRRRSCLARRGSKARPC
jgi:hypothetical protein